MSAWAPLSGFQVLLGSLGYGATVPGQLHKFLMNSMWGTLPSCGGGLSVGVLAGRVLIWQWVCGGRGPAGGGDLMRFASLLEDNQNHSSIKVSQQCTPFISTMAFPSWFAASAWGIKRVQSLASPRRLPITVDHLKVIEGHSGCFGPVFLRPCWQVHSQISI